MKKSGVINEEIFLNNFSLVFKMAVRLSTTRAAISKIFPVTEKILKGATEKEVDYIELLIARYSKLQDFLGNKMFRGILLLDREEAKTMRDTMNKMEKKYVLDSAEIWDNMREARNRVTHEYIPDGEDAVKILNEIFKQIPQLLKIVGNIYTYAQEEIGLDMSRFDMKQLKISKKINKKTTRKNRK